MGVPILAGYAEPVAMIDEPIVHCVHGVLFWILDHWAEQAVFFVGFTDGVVYGIVDLDYCEGIEVEFLFIVRL